MTEASGAITDSGEQAPAPEGADDPPPSGETFGRRLRRAREDAGLSQVALAGEELHPSYVSLLESDRRTPTPGVVAYLAGRLGMTAGELTGDVGDDLLEQLLLADAALATGRPADAATLLASSAGALPDRRLASDVTAFRAAQVYATALERSARIDEATAMLERLRVAAETAPGRLPWLPVMVALVRCYREAGDLARAVDLGEATLRRYRELRLEGIDGYAALVSTLAGVYSERGDHLRAKTMLDELVEQADQGGSRDDRGYAYWNAAVNAAERGHVGEGLRLAERATALLAEGEDDRSLARLQVTRAWLMLAEQPPDAAGARRILRAALPEVRQHAGALSVASAETELARCELLLGRAEVARRLAQSALTRLSPEHRVERARAYTALGASLVALGETAVGVVELEAAADALAELDSPRQAAAVWRQLSGVFRSLGDAERALDAADRAMDSAGLTNQPVAPVPPAGSPATARRRAVR